MRIPRGFRFGGVAAGLKPQRRDLALVVSDHPAAAAGLFTVNKAAAAPTQDARPRVPAEGMRAIVANSGNANALTGPLANGHYWLGVHIADVAHYVQEGSALDREAYDRGTSVYFPERAVHMFPEALATGVCSLNPQVDRLVQSCLMEVTTRGEVVRYEMHDGVIRSTERMTYTAVNAILTGQDPDVRARHATLVPTFERMGELFAILNRRRRQRGSVDFDLPEPEVVLDTEGLVADIIPSERNVAHRLIEEFMLLANETVASHLERTGMPSLYRIHEAPDTLKVEEFEAFVSALGYSLAGIGRPEKLCRLRGFCAGSSLPLLPSSLFSSFAMRVGCCTLRKLPRPTHGG